MNKSLIAACAAVALSAACSVALAKIPAPTLDDAAKAKAAEAAAKTAWQGKVDAWQLCKAQDRVAAFYAKTSGKAVPASAKAAPVKAAAPAAKPAVSTAPAASPPSAPTTGQAPGAAPPPCSDPGPFAYAPPEQKPLAAAGAQAPATSPPGANKPSGEMAKGKKS